MSTTHDVAQEAAGSGAMAISNRDRVGRGFELFADGMTEFVDRHMSAAHQGATDWLELVAAQDVQHNGGQIRALSKSDPSVQLRMLTENRRLFADSLSREHGSIASLLRNERNRHAHNEPFTPRQAMSALSHMADLLRSVGSAEQAAAVEKLWNDTSAAMAESQAKRTAKRSEADAAVGGEGLKPWREVVQPHPDITSGNFNAAEYAANLAPVVKREAADEYGDPIEFFRRTHLTRGLQWLLKTAARRFAGDINADPVINLQTNFGGGKTHSMIALYHLASGTPVTDYPDDLQNLLGELDVALPTKPLKRAVIVGTELAPGMARVAPDGTEIRTLWGELAWQLAGAKGYALVAEADRTASNPGEAFHEVLRLAGPSLILVDEWVAYARQLLDSSKPLVGGTFETQFTFAQLLTEAVAAAPGTLLAISLPESKKGLETGGTNGEAALEKLKNVVGRTVSQWHPATQDEAFEIVRRRLFLQRDAEAVAQVRNTARRFREMYTAIEGVPQSAKEAEYERRLFSCYPIHPELFDRLYETWSTLERFQRTRGVLRLMSRVIYELWESEDSSPIIMPGSLPLGSTAVLDELCGYVDDNWRAIADVDVVGTNSTAKQVDRKPLFGSRHMTRRLAYSLFFGSVPTLGTSNQGIDFAHLLLGTAMPGDTVNNFIVALQQYADSAQFLYSDHGRWWFNTQPSMTRTVKDLAEEMRGSEESIFAEIIKRLAEKQLSQKGDFAAVYPAPANPEDVRDRDEVCLVIVHPAHPHVPNDEDSTALRFAKRAVAKRGDNSTRENANMLAFLAADSGQLDVLMESVRFHVAWAKIVKEHKRYNLTAGQLEAASDKAAGFNRSVDKQIDSTYIWLLTPEQLMTGPREGTPVEWKPVRAETGDVLLHQRAGRKLKNQGKLYTSFNPGDLRRYLDTSLSAAWEPGHVSVEELWKHFCKYPYLPRLKSREVLDDALKAAVHDVAWRQQGIALANGYDSETGEYSGLVFVGHDAYGFDAVTDSTLIVKPSLAEQQVEQEMRRAAQEEAGGSESPGSSSGSVTVGTGETVGVPPVEDERMHVFHGRIQIDSALYAKQLSQLQEEILPHLADRGSSLRLDITVTATNAEGFTDAKVRTVTENASQLRFFKNARFFEQQEIDLEVD